MKFHQTIAAVLTLVSSLIFTACEEDGKENNNLLLLLLGGGNAFSAASTPGERVTVTVGDEEVSFRYANNQASITFPFSPTAATPVNNDKATLTRMFFMSETQVTNALFAEVLQWAYNNGRFSTTAGAHNEINATAAKYGTRELIIYGFIAQNINYSAGTFSVTSGFENHPVVYVSWYGAILFCNWLTEMREGNTAHLVYTGIDNTWTHTETVEDAAQTGYRLPSSEEFEYAARYIGTTAPTAGDLATNYIARDFNSGHADLTAGYYWTHSQYASGATKSYSNETETRAVAWYDADPAMGGASKVMPVAQKTANQLGLYDMSGNAWEWCFSVSGANRVARGGSYIVISSQMRVGYWLGTLTPDSRTGSIGFRFARTK